MRTLSVTLALFALTVGSAVGSIRSSQDVLLRNVTLATSFGGDGTVTGKCCKLITACTDAATEQCRSYNNNSAACATGHDKSYQAKYAKKCQDPDVANPAVSCTDYEKDINGRPYRCLAAFKCAYDTLSGVCSRGADDDPFAVFGYLSCSSNCPVVAGGN